MVNKCMQSIVILSAVGVLGVILLSFGFAKFPEAKQVPSRTTGYPTWHGPFADGYDPDRNDAMLALANISLLITGFIGLKIVLNPIKRSQSFFYSVTDNNEGGVGVPTLGFDQLLVLYVFVTFLTTAAAQVLEIGKVFVVFGVFHNAAEVIILSFLGSGGRIKNSSFFGWILLYTSSIAAFSVVADFPNDAVFFKFQGLCIDFALVIQFVRIYIATKEHLREAGNDALPLHVEEEDNNYDDSYKFWPTTIEHPKQLLLLVAASVLHLTGNVLTTFDPESGSILLFLSWCYATVFPIYIVFVYIDIRAISRLPKRIYIPHTPRWKVILITIISITLSLLCIRITLFIMS